MYVHILLYLEMEEISRCGMRRYIWFRVSTLLIVIVIVIFCGHRQDVEFASKRLKGIPIMGDDATTFTEKGYYSVPRVYIRTLLDEAVKPHFQDRYIAVNPPTAVLHLESDHSPFFSAPEELHQLLLSIAATYAKG